jgi:putative membrane protein
MKALLVSATIAVVGGFTNDLVGQGSIGAAAIRHTVPVRKPSLSLYAEKAPRPGSMMAATVEEGRVPYGESSRKYRRTVFSHKDWVTHRSSDRLKKNLNGIFFSGIVRQLFEEISLVTAIATGVVVWNSILSPEFGLPTLCLPTQPFTLSSPALGLLLVFRTNASYQRWLEARMRWGTIITQSRNVVRMASTWAPVDSYNEAGKEALDRLVVAAWLFPRSIMNKLTGPDDDDDYKDELLKQFGGDEYASFVSRILSAPDRPLAALMNLSLAVNALPIDMKRCVEIDKSLVVLGDSLGACERIFTSPVPLVYTRHTARFLSLWMLLLPFAMYAEFAKSSTLALPLVPASAILALFLFGIEELAVQLEEPFSILPMQRFCDGILQANTGLRDWTMDSKGMDSNKQ